MSYQFKILYYGPKTNKEIATQLSSLIEIDGEINAMPKNKVFKQREIKNNEVYFADYDMVQVEVTFYRNAGGYNADNVPTIRLFNEYFGGGMGSIVRSEERRVGKECGCLLWALHHEEEMVETLAG